MKTLIIATDFSKEAENALEYAGALAQQMHVKLVLVNSFSIPVHAANSLLSASAFQDLMDHNNEVLNKRALKLASEYSIEVDYECGLLDLTNELDQLMVKHNARLVIMGMAARSVEQDLFGNTTTAAIMKLKYPVLAIPMGSKFEGIKRILFASDERQDEIVLDKIKDLATVLKAEVEVFYVAKTINDLKAKGGELASAPIITGVLGDVPHYYKSVEPGPVIKEIEKEVINFNADLLIMVPHKYGFLESILHRSKTRIMASNNSVPLLSIPSFK